MPATAKRRNGAGVPADPEASSQAELCALCGRCIPPHARANRHHLTPRSRGGARLPTVRLHQICHSAIHARYSEAEIARRLNRIDLLRADPELGRFIAWVRTKPDDFHAPTRTSRSRKGRKA